MPSLGGMLSSGWYVLPTMQRCARDNDLTTGPPHGDECSNPRPLVASEAQNPKSTLFTSDNRAIISGTVHTISPRTESCRLVPSTSNQIFRAPSSSNSPAEALTVPPPSATTRVSAPMGPELSKPCRAVQQPTYAAGRGMMRGITLVVPSQ